MTSSWLVVLLCTERFIAVCFPLHAKHICSKKNTAIFISVCYLIIGVYNSVWSYATKMFEGTCFYDIYDRGVPGERTLYGMFLIGACTIYSFIPTLIMLTLTPIIVVKLANRAKFQRQVSNQHTKKSTKDEMRMTAMLLGVVIAYVILIIPVTLLHLLSFVFDVHAFGDNPANFLIFRDVSQILEQINYAVNFILYTGASKTFRSELIKLLCCIKLRSEHFNRFGTKSSDSRPISSISRPRSTSSVKISTISEPCQ